MNRKQRRANKGKPQGRSYADVLAQRRQVKEAVREMARDATVEIQINRGLQRGLWMAVASVSDAYGFGPKRMKPFFEAFQANSDELNKMLRENDEDYAYEQLRRKAERVTGMSIQYLYEDEMLAAEAEALQMKDGGDL